MNRRGFLKTLTSMAVAIAAAPAITELTRFIPPPPEVALAWDAVTFRALLEMYLPTDLLREELMKRSYVLEKVQDAGGWRGITCGRR